MAKISQLALLIAGLSATSSYAMNPQPDPENPGGYIIERAEITAAEDTRTLDPMYDVWAKALETRPNTEVEAIYPDAASNPDNVKRVERVFPESEWNKWPSRAIADVHNQLDLSNINGFKV